ncbi:MAG: hypothetical protein CVV44_09795 [Spirochaetae bacterium HGW-Spirochaetae-1]|jgi:hypothetical protein|nr:MAG: hypothetical protein CVV44_09795 [Spirochaetae bacterium HGW-Spirochaetae-1]
MGKRALLILFLSIPVFLFSQEPPKETDAGKKTQKNIPVLAQYSNRFTVKPIYFNKRIDVTGKGDILEIEMVIENLTDDPIDMYIFTIATFENVEATRSSFERPIPPAERIKTFVASPDDIKNFEYPVYDEQGNIKKDFFGKEIVEYKKYPHEPRKGVDPTTGKAYHLVDKLVLRTYHLSVYKKNYYFFNEAALLIFDMDGNPVYRQLYDLKNWRR